MVTVTLYEPVYGEGAHSGRKLYDAVGTLRRQAPRSTVEEEGGDVQIGSEQIKVTYLDPRVRSGWYAQMFGQWYRVSGVRQAPPKGIAGYLDLEPNADVREL